MAVRSWNVVKTSSNRLLNRQKISDAAHCSWLYQSQEIILLGQDSASQLCELAQDWSGIILPGVPWLQRPWISWLLLRPPVSSSLPPLWPTRPGDASHAAGPVDLSSDNENTRSKISRI